ncbi:MAG: glycosyltransferase, partial [Nitrospinota bacterium]
EKVVFTGVQKAVEWFYAASDVLVFPSFYEASSLVLIEAMASGLPVIASRTGGAEDFIRDGRNGFLLSSFENIVEELSSKMEWFLRNRSRRQEMGEKARETALAYSWDRVVRETLAVYGQILRTREC